MTQPLLPRRAFLGAGAAALASIGNARAAAAKPNVLLLMADDLGYECLGCYGGTSYRTPHLDRLASGGIRFTHAYAQPLCTPTRVQLMTGKYNFRNWQAFGVLDAKARTFGHLMREAGYQTAIAGKWQLHSYNPPDFEPEWRGKGMTAEQSGFDEYCLWHAHHTEDKGSRYADPVIYQNGRYRDDTKGKYGPDLYTQFLCDFMERNRERPFFAYYPMALTHGPFNPTPRTPEWQSGNRLQGNAKFFGPMVEYMDEVVGRLAAKLDELGLREKTAILYFSDNGSPRGIHSRLGGGMIEGGKGLPTDAGTRVPMIANWKGTAPAGRVLDDLVDSTDFYPTLAALGGARLGSEGVIDGQCFAPQLRGRRGTPRQWTLCHHDPRPGHAKAEYSLVRFARDQRWKLYEDNRLFDIPNDVLERKPLAPGEGGGEAAAARRKLRAVLDRLK